MVLLNCVAATSTNAGVFTLQQALEHALTHAPELHASDAARAAAQSRYAAARGSRWPTLDMSYSARRGNNPLDAFADKLNTRSVVTADFDPLSLNDPAASEIHATQLLLKFPLYTGGQLDAQIRRAREQADAASAMHSRNRGVTVFRVTTAYHALQAAQQAETIAADALAAARRHAATATRLADTGRTVVSDQVTAEVFRAAVAGLASAAATRREQAYNELQRVMGLDTETTLEVAPWTEPDITLPAADQTLTREALSRRQDRRAQQARAAAGSAAVDAARAAYRPQVSLLGSSDWFDDEPGLENRSWRVMGVVSMNLFSGGSDRNRVAAARYDLVEEQARLESMDLSIHHELRQALASLRGAVERYRIASASVGQARRGVKLVDERYGQGRTILIDLLQAERALVDTRSEAVSAALAVYEARAALTLASGTAAENQQQ